MKFGYARVSTTKQDLQRQIALLENMKCDEILTEKISGTKTDRASLNLLKEKVRKDDIVIIESFSRLGRSTKDLIELVNFFEEKEVKIVSIKEDFDTTTPHGKLMLTVFQAFAQFEADLIRERTKEGLKQARKRGRKGGRPKVNSKQLERAIKLYKTKEYSLKEIREITNISTATLYRYLNNK